MDKLFWVALFETRLVLAKVCELGVTSGRVLMKSAAADSIVLQAPGGTEYLTVLELSYEAHFYGTVP